MIIGAGISGLSIAYEALSLGLKITIVDENQIYQGTTISTTAKITTQHGYIYHDLIKMHGIDAARKFYDFNDLGIRKIEEIVKREKIECDFQIVKGYLFAVKEEEVTNIEKEYRAYKTLGIDGEMVNIDEKISPHKALRIRYQANFNIEKYLKALTDILLEKGVEIYENTRIIDVYQSGKAIALTNNEHKITANNIVIAAHYPIYKGFNFYFMKIIPKMSYSILSKPISLEIEDANYTNTISNPKIALRFIKTEEGNCLNISGATHDSKKFTPYLKQIEILKKFGKSHFSIENYPYEWCAQDYTSTDYFPLIGRVSSSIFIMAAYNKWGMSTAASAAIMLREMISGKTSPFEEIFRPEKVKFNKKLITYNLGMVSTLLKTRNVKRTNLLNLESGTGTVRKIGSKRVGIYKDHQSKLYIVDATCPHMRCGLRFNPLEKSYDCKCHGSRFDYQGRLFDGPARSDLKIIPLSEIKNYLETKN